MSSKENKKLAQQRRAEERARAAQRAKMKRIGIGVAVVAVIAALIVLPGKFGGATDEDTETAEETAGEAETDAVDETESIDTDSAAGAAEPTQLLRQRLRRSPKRRLYQRRSRSRSSIQRKAWRPKTAIRSILIIPDTRTARRLTAEAPMARERIWRSDQGLISMDLRAV